MKNEAEELKEQLETAKRHCEHWRKRATSAEMQLYALRDATVQRVKHHKDKIESISTDWH